MEQQLKEVEKKVCLNTLLHRYSFQHINNRELLKTLWEKKKLLIMSNFFFFPQCFLLSKNIVSPFVNNSDIISLFAAESEEPKLSYQVKG